MQIQKLAIREQLVKKVVKSGNGGAVWVPKNWLGQEIIVILPEKPKLSTKENIIHLLEPYLKDVIAVFVYGSYARHEETKDSDADVMVITKDKTIQIGIKEPNLEITAFKLDKLKNAIQKHPVMYYQMVQEAEPIINAGLLEELRNINPSNESFRDYLSETKEHIESDKELIELDKLDGEYVKSYSILYSIILRLRGVFIARCIFEKENFSNKAFKEWLMEKWLSNQEFEECYKIYKAIKKDKNIKNNKIKISVAEKLLAILLKETTSIEAELYGK